ncbi:hypothetical protein GGR51DRAFT_190754 [Nemania sp. FL0031]|nr:hypothetical protein GGR51DRAFT_190754 [Nemania sp. FL0031]
MRYIEMMQSSLLPLPSFACLSFSHYPLRAQLSSSIENIYLRALLLVSSTLVLSLLLLRTSFSYCGIPYIPFFLDGGITASFFLRQLLCSRLSYRCRE